MLTFVRTKPSLKDIFLCGLEAISAQSNRSGIHRPICVSGQYVSTELTFNGNIWHAGSSKSTSKPYIISQSSWSQKQEFSSIGKEDSNIRLRKYSIIFEY